MTPPEGVVSAKVDVSSFVREEGVHLRAEDVVGVYVEAAVKNGADRAAEDEEDVEPVGVPELGRGEEESQRGRGGRGGSGGRGSAGKRGKRGVSGEEGRRREPAGKTEGEGGGGGGQRGRREEKGVSGEDGGEGSQRGRR